MKVKLIIKCWLVCVSFGVSLMGSLAAGELLSLICLTARSENSKPYHISILRVGTAASSSKNS